MSPSFSSPASLGRWPEGPEGPPRGLSNKDHVGSPSGLRPPSPRCAWGRKRRPFLRVVAILLSGLLLTATAAAHEGHDHGDSGPPVTGTRSPRFEAKSDLFELVGILDKGTVRLFLDRFASNEPVTDATIDIEAGSSKATAARQADGTYLFEADILRQPGTVALAFTVTAGTDIDLLAANLVIPDPHHDHPAGPGRLAALWPGIAVGVGGSAVVALIAIGAALLWRRRGVRP